MSAGLDSHAALQVWLTFIRAPAGAVIDNMHLVLKSFNTVPYVLKCISLLLL